MNLNIKTNSSLCIMPWIHSYVGCLYERKLCCLSDDVTQFKKSTTEEFWNSDFMKSVRLRMLNGEKIPECHICYENEKLGMESMRQSAFTNIMHRDFNINADGSLENKPSYFDYRTIHCNLHCVSCGDNASSSHISLRKKMGSPLSKEVQNFKIDVEYEKLMADEIIQSVIDKKCIATYWAGGEPMLSKIHWKVLYEILRLNEKHDYKEYIKNIEIFYNTNLTNLMKDNQLIPQILKPLQPSIQCSLDGVYETIEYTRDGCHWEDIKRNWNEYYNVLNEYKQFGIASVLSSPVILDIDRYFDFFIPYDPIMHNHHLICNISKDTTPYFLDIRYFPKNIFDRVIDHAIEKFENCGLRRSKQSIDILKSYKIEKEKSSDIFDNPENHKRIKKRTLFRDKYLTTNRSFGDLLKIIDLESYEWYMSIN